MADIKQTTDEATVDESGQKRLKKYDPSASRMKALKERGQNRLDNWLTENVVNPIAENGHEDAAAALATIPATAYDFAVPESELEAATMLVPGGKALGAAEKAVTRTGEKALAKTAEKEAVPVTSRVFEAGEKPALETFGDRRYTSAPVKETYLSAAPVKELKDSKVRKVKFPGQSDEAVKELTPVANPKRR